MTTLPSPWRWESMYPRAKQRFPHLCAETVPSLAQDRDGFVAYLADTHHLTLREAEEEVDDFLFTESLHAELATDQA
ncbi:hypothetical protein [Pseudophaeobacter flagellatus]|uniref:hypothetical protein n=1 Tax=Pseudophaeobacter flagellatus TaxID=2899119 RepID=UPI001E4E6966|nr:hypothetical protein [Pseudophaeobacter flagellatus]MCD9146878.1 hypothetical protein [Pseudophaeobacter flagellatus]